MHSEVRRLALLAALKTTRPSTAESGRSLLIRQGIQRSSLALGLAGGLIGCAMSHDVPALHDAAQPDAAREDAAIAADAPADAGADAPVACEDLLASAEVTGEDFGARFASDAVRLDPAVGACCQQWDLDLEEGRRMGEGWPPSPLAYACCDVVVSAQHLATTSNLGCTPWGPPCPPEMPLPV